MIGRLVFALPGNEAMSERLAALLGGEVGRLETRCFPDGETYLRFLSPPENRDVTLVCTLAHPDDKIPALLFAAATARELGATGVGLIAPYLAYMRQDRRFKPGEAVTSRLAAGLLSHAFDWLVTVDPHLHRYASLSEIYTIPARAVHAAPLISDWVRTNVTAPVLIGPDAESEQWVEAVARTAGAPFTVLEKTRLGDRDVEIKVKHMERLQDRTPVLIDDIISSGRTMLEAVRHVAQFTEAQPVCLAVHGIFAEDSDVALAREGARIVTTNTVRHASNAIDVAPLLAEALTSLS
ncbi:MAG: ribose-phosphate pyrophosphokinase [Proteobacteria bacterium]|nr:ribose-phosphate pyrophosphokinase [Pseudomonadota bacterium]